MDNLRILEASDSNSSNKQNGSSEYSFCSLDYKQYQVCISVQDGSWTLNSIFMLDKNMQISVRVCRTIATYGLYGLTSYFI